LQVSSAGQMLYFAVGRLAKERAVRQLLQISRHLPSFCGSGVKLRLRQAYRTRLFRAWPSMAAQQSRFSCHATVRHHRLPGTGVPAGNAQASGWQAQRTFGPAARSRPCTCRILLHAATTTRCCLLGGRTEGRRLVAIMPPDASLQRKRYWVDPPKTKITTALPRTHSNRF